MAVSKHKKTVENSGSCAYWPEAIQHLAARDVRLAGVIKSYEGELLVSRGEAFVTLARAIVGQQISVKAADTVWRRLAEAVPKMVPRSMLKMEEEALRACGLSRSKVVYLKSLAEHFDIGRGDLGWHAMSDDEVIRDLTSIKGIGRWTAEMFLIFHLMRPDVFPVADIGLQKAMERLYTGGKKITPKRMVTIAKKWQPYRSVATWYLWRSLDPVPVEY